MARSSRTEWSSFLELFYDLVFVVLIAQVAHTLAGNVTWSGFRDFAIVFALVWIAWLNGSLYHELHGREDGRNRTSIFVQMGLLVLLAVYAAHAADRPDDGRGYLIVYAVLLTFIALLGFGSRSLGTTCPDGGYDHPVRRGDGRVDRADHHQRRRRRSGRSTDPLGRGHHSPSRRKRAGGLRRRLRARAGIHVSPSRWRNNDSACSTSSPSGEVVAVSSQPRPRWSNRLYDLRDRVGGAVHRVRRLVELLRLLWPP